MSVCLLNSKVSRWNFPGKGPMSVMLSYGKHVHGNNGDTWLFLVSLLASSWRTSTWFLLGSGKGVGGNYYL